MVFVKGKTRPIARNGSNSSSVLDCLRTYESRNVTQMAADGSWPIVWKRARGMFVWDEAGRKYLDLTAAFGVAAAGHANPRIVKAGQRQMATLLHAMGDVHPHPWKARLARELSRITFERWNLSGQAKTALHGKVIFGSSGFEAVEAALKTAMMATGRPGIIVFEGGYHGLGYGALNATHRAMFRQPFLHQLREFGHFVKYPTSPEDLGAVERQIRRIVRQQKIGAILVEPVQGRGGIRVPPMEFLPLLSQLGQEHEVLLVLDEIYTGFGRTGFWFACERSGVVPDLICLGKALTGGFPLSACVGRADLMDAAWPASSGEAIHTSTYLGHPVGCAMALAEIEELERARLVERSARMGGEFKQLLQTLSVPSFLRWSVHGLGFMLGVELNHRDGKPATDAAWKAILGMLRRGYVLLPEGPYGNVLGLTPPLIITRRQMRSTVESLSELLQNLTP